MALLNNRGKVYLGDTLISGLPELTNKGSATDLAYGKELIDGDGNVVTGTLGDFKPGDEGRYIFRTNARVSGGTSLFVEAESSPRAAPIIHRPGSTATVQISSEAFGDATAADVAKGKKFTSAAGLLVEGTMEAIDCGQYCWKKYAVNKSYQITREALGTTAPDDLGGSYQSYTITDDGYFKLNSGSITISTYHLPSGASNGETKYIYYKEWKYALGDSNYEYSRLTLSDTYTEKKSAFLGYVISNESTEYPEDGIAADGYWYVLISNS